MNAMKLVILLATTVSASIHYDDYSYDDFLAHAQYESAVPGNELIYQNTGPSIPQQGLPQQISPQIQNTGPSNVQQIEPQQIQILVPEPYPVYINVDQSIQIPVYRVVPQIIQKPVPYTVERPFPFEVKKLYPVEVIKKVEVFVPKPYPVPYNVYKHVFQEEQTYKMK